jgi:hypothetical protein
MNKENDGMMGSAKRKICYRSEGKAPVPISLAVRARDFRLRVGHRRRGAVGDRARWDGNWVAST